MTLPDVITARELANELRLGETTIRDMFRRGELPEATRVGGRILIHSSAVQRLKPQPVTLPNEWQEAEHPASASPNAPRAADDGASDGANEDPAARNDSAQTVTRPKTAPKKSGNSFAARYPHRSARSA